SCLGTEPALSECPAKPSGCSRMESVSVTCTGSGISNTSKIRLVGGMNECSGRVEVFYNHEWGTVCDDDWDMNDATVVCRQLGCGMALSALGSAHFGMGSSRIWLDDVNCTGAETDFSQCKAMSWGTHNCHHGEDAGVVCQGNTSSADLRLVNGPHHCAGRVEVLHNEQWGTVCDDSWDLNDATVVCRELGCGRAQSAPTRAPFEQGSGPIWLDDVSCVGTEQTLSECRFRPWGQNNCNHGEDAGVVCSDIATSSNLRLVNGPHHCAGRVEVLHNEQWGTVCDDVWKLNNAMVVCRQLGCGRAESAPTGARFGQGSGPIWLDDVSCVGTEDALSECRFRPWGQNNCNHGEDAGVVCSGTDAAPSFNLRLVNGPNRCAGRVEVLHNEQWGTVCDDVWQLNNAMVVCRQLGCGRAQSAPTGARFGQGSGPIWLDDVSCVGTEQTLSECRLRPWGQNNCNHGEDAGVVCSGNA
ncbi:DMBT1 protein, partial [Eudromia elegans]|nr:DMBT1 protein [Eudromia elegans]